MRVLVTGAAGFIGSHVCTNLAAHGHDVLGIDNLDDYYPATTKSLNVAAAQAAGAEFAVSDVRRAADVQRIVSEFGPDSIVHLAGKAGVRASLERPAEYVETNVGGTVSVLEAARSRANTRVVIASTSSVYAGSVDMPFDESYAAIEPLQPYAASKRAAELIAQTYSRSYGLSVAVTRFFTVYGERGRPDMMPMRLARSIAFGEPVTVFDGDLHRDWTHVSDIAEGLRLAAEHGGGFDVVNLGFGRPVSLLDFIRTLEETAGGEVNVLRTPCPASEMQVTWASIERARGLFGFEPVVDVTEGLSRFWSWFENHIDRGSEMVSRSG